MDTERKCYPIGLYEQLRLIVDNDDMHYIYQAANTIQRNISMNISDKTLEVKKWTNGKDIDEATGEYQIQIGVIKQIKEDGSRWEGDWYNKQPFGFGCVYDGEGNRMYCGFMFEGKKIGYGEEYFSDNHKVDYCGYFMNDLRHGWGTTYDRNGNKLYEGDWRFGMNDFENERIVIKNKADCMKIHDLIKELVIGDKLGNKWKEDLIIKNYPNLQSIVVKNNSLQYLKSLKICNCEKLKMIDMDKNSCYFIKTLLLESTFVLFIIIITSS